MGNFGRPRPCVKMRLLRTVILIFTSRGTAECRVSHHRSSLERSPVIHSVQWPSMAGQLTGGARVNCSPGQVSRKLLSARMSLAKPAPLLARRRSSAISDRAFGETDTRGKCENSLSHVMVVRSRSENDDQGGSSWPRVSKSQAVPPTTGAFSPSSGSLSCLRRSCFPLHPESPKSRPVRWPRPISP